MAKEIVWKNLPLDEVLFDKVFDYLNDLPTAYGFGHKIENIRNYPPVPQGGRCDCSGFARGALYVATKIDIGDGSYNQGEFFQKYGLKETLAEYTALTDNRWRVCVHHADNLDETGHIWFVRNGLTRECYGGHGVGSRHYNAVLSTSHRLNELQTLTFVL